MEFLKETKSYQFVTLLEKLEIEHKYVNIVIYLIKLIKFNWINNRIINRKGRVDEKIKMILYLFKERYYLDQIKNKYNMNEKSTMNNDIINNIIISEIAYNTIKIYIEYGLMDKKYSIHVINSTSNKSINITENDLNNKFNYNICIHVLNMLSYEVNLILKNILRDSIRRVKNV